MQNNVFYKHIGDYFMIKRHRLIGFAVVAAFFLLLSCKNNLSPEIPVEDIIISSNDEGEISGEISIVSGMSKSITVKIIPENATNKTLAYSSTPGEVAAIDSSGSIRAYKVGDAVIKITAANGVQKTINVRVTPEPIHVRSIVFENPVPESLVIGESYRIIAKAQPDEATNKELTYTADNDKAYVAYDGDGTVTAQSEGTVTITAKSQSNPEITKTVTFTIKPPPKIELIEKEIESNSDKENPAFTVKTLHGKLHYTPEVVGDGKEWLSFIRKDTSVNEEDLIHLKAKPNKTVWDRVAYIKFKDANGRYIKGADGNELEVIFTQKENKNPIVTIKWVDGIDDPTPSEKTAIPVPHVGQAKKFYWDDDKIFFWYEGDNTKWFNNRKIFYLKIPATDGGDSNQCWAKTASNMLHWWFVQNEDNINNYITKKNITSPKKDEYQHFYKRNSPDNEEPEKSYIAKTFRTKAHNGQLGGYVMSGLAWYLYGNTSASHPSTPTYEGPALFKDVFNIDKTPIEDKIIKSKVEFETAITEALNSKKAIGLHMRGTKGGKDYAHGITLWGAVFDEEENIIAIYVVDNNHTENRIFPYGIYYRNGLPYIFNYPNNAFATDRYVGEVITLDKGEELWQEWFRTH